MARKPKNPERRKMIWLGVVLAILLGPLMVPVSTSGSITHKEAAGPNGTFFEWQGIDIHYRLTSAQANCPAPSNLVVLIHGFGASTFSWLPVEDKFSPCDDVIAYDRPAFGLTERKLSWDGLNPYSMAAQQSILTELIAKFANGRPAILVGHSAGGVIASQFALDNPDQVSKLVLEAPAILNSTPGADSSWFTYIPQLNHIGPLIVSSIASSGMDLLNESYHDTSKLTDDIIAGYRVPLTIQNWEFAFWEFSRADRLNNVASRLTEFKMPVLIVTGDDDRVVETALSRELATKMPSAEFVVISNSGHLPHEETTEEFMSAVRKFIN
jgi:pimeloyl-ACP methyl ester carboxylesterase